MPAVFNAPVDLLPEVPPAVKPVPVQLVAFVEFHDSVDDCPVTMVDGLAESVAVGAGNVQVGGLFPPLLHINPPPGLIGLPPPPEHPPLLQEVHDPLTYAWPFEHCCTA